MSESAIDFTVFCRAEPQGSKRAFVVTPKGGGKPRAVIVDNSQKMKPFRQEMTRTAMTHVVLRPWAAKHVPIRLRLDFYFVRPASIPASRVYPVVKPDADKLERAVMDALTAVLYADDAQVVQLIATKNYGDVEKVRVRADIL